MRPTYVTGVTMLAASVTMVACAGDDKSDLSGAYCADLEAGLTPAQMAGSASDVIDDMTPERYAARAYVWVDDACPDQLDSNETLRVFLEANNIDPDG